MGKGQRNKERKQNNITVVTGRGKTKSMSEKEFKKYEEKKKLRKEYASITAIAVAVLAVILAVALIVIQINTKPLNDTISVVSDVYEIDNAMMGYFLYSNYNTFVNNYSSYLQYYGLDTTKTLKSQKYGTGTWFDYFLNQTKAQVTEYILLAEEASQKGYTVTTEEIDNEINTLRDLGKKQGYTLPTFIKYVYCDGVDEDAIRRALEISMLATKYRTILVEGFEFTDEEIVKYKDDNPASYLMADFISYTFTTEVTDNMTEDEIKAANEQTKLLADALAENKGFDEFKAAVKNIIKSKDSTKEDSAVDTEVEKLITEEYYYNTSNELGKWIFDKETKVGDTFVYAETNKYTVYCLKTATYLDENETVNVRHILFSATKYGSDSAAKAKAEEIKAQFLAGTKDAAAFGALAKQYNEDTGSKELGGLYKNVTKGYMVSEFDEWIFNEERVAGDVEIVKTTYGYHLIYFEGEGLISWKADVLNALQQQKFTQYISDLEKYSNIEFDNGKLNQIP